MEESDGLDQAEEVAHRGQVGFGSGIDGLAEVAGQPSEVLGAPAESQVRWPSRCGSPCLHGLRECVDQTVNRAFGRGGRSAVAHD
ncbi:MAG: hypothetical protein VB093_04230, partial [Propionicimonas sp.]|nr:hypothetical protein [Propionicimonas sp.]